MSVAKSISDAFQKAKLNDTDAFNASPQVFLDTGIPQLNSIISGTPSGGLPCGQVAEIHGESGSGKTMLATRLMISAQKQGGYAMFYDFERAYHLHLSIKQGMNPDIEQFYYAKSKWFEEALDDCLVRAKLLRSLELIPANAPIIAIFDSFAAMVPLSCETDSKGKEKTLSNYTMNDMTALSRAASIKLKPFVIDVNDLNICAVFLNQMAASMETHGPTTKTKGGKSLPFYASTRLGIHGKEIKSTDHPPKLLGKEMTITTVKNRIRKPFEKIKVDFNFRADGSGDFEVLDTYVAYLKAIGVLDSGTWINYKGSKYQGTKNFVEYLNTLPDPIADLKELHENFIKANGGNPFSVEESATDESEA